MPDESTQEVLVEIPSVADGQAVVDAVATDTQNIVDGAVQEIGTMLRSQADESNPTSEILVDATQWDELAAYLRFAATSSLCCTFAIMAIFGAVCAGHLVKGWRRG